MAISHGYPMLPVKRQCSKVIELSEWVSNEMATKRSHACDGGSRETIASKSGHRKSKRTEEEIGCAIAYRPCRKDVP